MRMRICKVVQGETRRKDSQKLWKGSLYFRVTDFWWRSLGVGLFLLE